jgi:MFS family permease
MWGFAVAVYVTAVFHRNALAVASLLAERRFGVGPSTLAGLVAVQLGIYAAMQIPSGLMTDRFGPRRMLAVAALLMGGGELVFAAAHVTAVALVGRGLVGLGDAVTFLSVLRLVQNWFPVRRYGLLAALTSLMGGAGQLVSTVPLHLGLEHFGWGATFGATALVTFAAAVPMWLVLHDRPADTPGALVPPGRALPPVDPTPVRTILGEVMRRPGTWQGMWAHFALTGAFAVFTALWGYPFLVRAQRYSAARASASLGLVVASSIVAAPVVGALMTRRPRSRVPMVYGVGAAICASWVAALLVGAGHVPLWLVVAILVSTGVGAPASAAAFDLAREANRPQRGGAATGVVNIGGFSAAVLSDLAIGALLATVGHGGHRPSGFEWPMACIPSMVAVGTAGFWWCGRRAHPWAEPVMLPAA